MVVAAFLVSASFAEEAALDFWESASACHVQQNPSFSDSTTPMFNRGQSNKRLSLKMRCLVSECARETQNELIKDGREQNSLAGAQHDVHLVSPSYVPWSDKHSLASLGVVEQNSSL